MKRTIPFDINLRSEIESGRYEVFTKDNKPTRIICWDMNFHGKTVVVGLVKNKDTSDEETCFAFSFEGKRMGLFKDENDDIVLVDTQVPDLTEFENKLGHYISLYSEKEVWGEALRQIAGELLEIAYKQFKEGEAEHMKDYVDDVRLCAYNNGLHDARKEMPMPEDTVLFQKGVDEGKRLVEADMPRWKELQKGETRVSKCTNFLVMWENGDGQATFTLANFVREGEPFICLQELCKLPKEDGK